MAYQQTQQSQDLLGKGAVGEALPRRTSQSQSQSRGCCRNNWPVLFLCTILLVVPVLTVLLYMAVHGLMSNLSASVCNHDHAADAAKEKWGYGDHGHAEMGPENWPDKYCQSGKRQSPIDIPKETYGIDVNDFIFKGYNRSITVALENYKFAAHVEIPPHNAPVLSGGGLPSAYILHSIHVHWSQHDYEGSEHTVQGRAFPIEMHFVHVKTSVPFGQAVKQQDGLAVLGVLGEIDETANTTRSLLNLKQGLWADKEDHSRTNLNLTLTDLLPEDTQSFYRYPGSLTTPNCAETVVWTVLKDTFKIKHDLLDSLRELRGEDKFPIAHNSRPTQALNGRTVYLREN